MHATARVCLRMRARAHMRTRGCKRRHVAAGIHAQLRSIVLAACCCTRDALACMRLHVCPRLLARAHTRMRGCKRLHMAAGMHAQLCGKVSDAC
jgi:hypothetical protein